MSKTNLLFGIVLIGLSGCAGPVSHYTSETTTPKRCTYIPEFSFGTSVQPDVRLQECKKLANQGDAEAAVIVGDYYSRSFRRDTREAIYWYSKAADLGNLKALRKVFDAYYYGWDVPKNLAKAEEYLAKAFESGADWAQLIIARRTEKTDPGKALELYQRVARKDNCHAQTRLALAYFNGDMADRNLTQAYFWLLLASTGGFDRRSDYHSLASLDDRFRSSPESCFSSTLPLIGPKARLESSLPPEFVRLAQEAATTWKPGQQEAILSAARVAESPPSRSSPKAMIPRPPRPSETPRSPDPAQPFKSAVGELPKWTPLVGLTQLPMRREPREPAKVFELASRSVWVVVAAQSEADLRRKRNVMLGSAVAITQGRLLTNCHVVEKRPMVWIKQAEIVEQATVLSADGETDRCILSVGRELLAPVAGIRRYDDLKVGEEVYTIGSPSGLENTLGQGIVSGLRRLDGQRLVQTTAQISPGSSGGGLFDKSGNLIGITTFKLQESEGLNFAIAAEDYFR